MSPNDTQRDSIYRKRNLRSCENSDFCWYETIYVHAQSNMTPFDLSEKRIVSQLSERNRQILISLQVVPLFAHTLALLYDDHLNQHEITLWNEQNPMNSPVEYVSDQMIRK